MLISWLGSSFHDSLINDKLSRSDLKLLAIQFCTHLLAAGVVRRLEEYDTDVETAYIFKPDFMYCWARSEPILKQLDVLPGKLCLESWPPLQELLDTEKRGTLDKPGQPRLLRL